MSWSAQIVNKSEVNSSGILTYELSILRDGEPVNGVIEVSDTPENIQQAISDRVTSFAGSYELADDLPVIGDIINVIE